MKKLASATLAALVMFGMVMFAPVAIHAQSCDGTGKNFVDLDGDGFNDNAPDHDGDGIPNGLDPDYIKNAQDGDGYKNGKLGENAKAEMTQERTMSQQQNKNQEKTMTQEQVKTQEQVQTGEQKFNRARTASGSTFQKKLGEGTGSGDPGSGTCDGTGPHGTRQQGGK